MNILEKIYQDKLIEVRNSKKQKSLHDICAQLKANPRKPQNFGMALANKISDNKIAAICEIKKASPSKGIIREDFDPIKIAKIYQENGATCLSILTDNKYFMGQNQYVSQVRKITNLPILRKEFIVDAYQIYETKLIGGDCILLIMAMINLETALEFEKIAHSIGLDVLIEVHNEEELDQALNLKSKLIGINNRNLKTLKVDINNSKKLSKLIPQDKIIICESGINSKADITEMQQHNINSFLIGESLMKSDNIGAKLTQLISN